MNGRWLLANRDALIRDLVRDFCVVHSLLDEQRERFMRDGSVSCSALRELLGEATRKGVFWQLKDTAHHLFRNRSEADADAADAPLPDDFPREGALPDGSTAAMTLEALIDWCIGYAFHECVKLREDAFQAQHYANRLLQISRYAAVTADMCAPLRSLGVQTAESTSRELARILHVLRQGLRLLASYVATERRNTRLARWLATEGEAAARAFGESYGPLLTALYGEDRELLFIMAARDFLAAGRREPALALLERARNGRGLGARGLALLHRVQAARRREAASLCSACNRERRPCLPVKALWESTA